mmetsp:Transcript_8729/g.12349  ORF Transcript_8729/g.12349 Transcript_8729/m.12349 type:complete len:605 (-) Transcript_8729:152-1966(-)
MNRYMSKSGNTVEMVDRTNENKIPPLDSQIISPVSVIPEESSSSNHPLKEQQEEKKPSSIQGDCDNALLPPSKTKQILRSACEKAYGQSLITDDEESFCSLDLPRIDAKVEFPPIQVGHDGAEVTLEGLSLDEHDQPSCSSAEQQHPRQVGSLLDLEATPSPAPMKREQMPYRPSPKAYADGKPVTTPDIQKSYPFGQQLCCGASPGDETTAIVAFHQQESIEKTICYFLSNPEEVVDFLGSWQAWSYFGMGPTSTSSPSVQLKDDIKESLRNRACNMSARARHIRKLKGNMNPFDFGNDHEIPEISLVRAQSYCVANGPTIRPQFKKRSSKRRSSPSRSEVSSGGSSFFSSILSCTDSGTGSESPLLVPTRSNSIDDDDLCYDSDPEDVIRTMPQETFSSLRYETFQDGPSERIEPKRLDFDINGSSDESVKATVEKILNERITLIQHNNILDSIGSDSKNSPSAVKAWIEHGQQLRGKLIQPKYMWKPAGESEQDMSKMGFSDSELKSIFLLDILRIVEAERMGSCAQSLAKSKHCFYIYSIEDTFMFEASNEMERNRIVQNLKIVVSRLASLVIVEDRQMFQEFFSPSPFSTMGPGEKPLW